MAYYSLIEGKRAEDGFHWNLRVKEFPVWLARLFGAKERELHFHGSGTVWYERCGDSLFRCDSGMESLLSNYRAGLEMKETEQ